MSCAGDCKECAKKCGEKNFSSIDFSVSEFPVFNMIKDSGEKENDDSLQVNEHLDYFQKNFSMMENFSYEYNVYSLPTTGMISLTDDCNLSCPYCFVNQKPLYMSLETATRSMEWLLDNFKTKKLLFEEGNFPYDPADVSVSFFGGEPLLRFDEIIKPIVEKYSSQISFNITTNGMLLDEDIVDFFVKHNMGVLLSFDGIEKVQNSQRPGKGFNSFQTILKNIPYLLLRMPNTLARATLTKKSLPHLFESCLMFEELGFQRATFCPNLFEEWGDEEGKLFQTELDKIGIHIMEKLYDETPHSPIRLEFLLGAVNEQDCYRYGEYPFYMNTLLRCGLATVGCGISPEGYIIPCQEKNSQIENAVGDVFDGINAEKHSAFLSDYFEKISNLKCYKKCGREQVFVCASMLCPSRLQDSDFKLNSTYCHYSKGLLRVAKRLYTLLGGSSLEKVQLHCLFQNRGVWKNEEN